MVIKCKIKDLRKNIVITNLVELLNKNAQLYYKRKNVNFVDFDFVERCYYQDTKELYKTITIYERSILFNDFGKQRNDLIKQIIENLKLLLEIAVKEKNKKVL